LQKIIYVGEMATRGCAHGEMFRSPQEMKYDIESEREVGRS